MDKIWKLLILFGVCAVSVPFGLMIFAPHTVQQYYVGRPSDTTHTNGYCVMASIDWETDDTVFCSDEIQKVMDTAKSLNESLGHK